MNWYQTLTTEQRQAYNQKRIKLHRAKRRQMSAEERKVARAKWRLAKQRQREERSRAESSP